MTENICATCKFWFTEDMASGSCRRYPPTIDDIQLQYARDMGLVEHYPADSVVWWESPRTGVDYWCGEHQQKTDDVMRREGSK